MSELESKSRALLDAARSARPSAGARERMRAGVLARIGAGAVVPASLAAKGASAAASPASAGLATSAAPMAAAPVAAPAVGGALGTAATLKVVALGVVLSSAGAIAVWSKPTAPVVDVSTHTATSAQSRGDAPSATATALFSEKPVLREMTAPPHEPVSSEVAPLDSSSAVREDESLPSHRSIVPRDRDAAGMRTATIPSAARVDDSHAPRAPIDGSHATSLGDENASMRDAVRSLKSGDGARALAVLDDLDGRHPGGVLREERMAARVLALCAVGNLEEARLEGRRFVENMPTSAQAGRVRASCAFDH